MQKILGFIVLGNGVLIELIESLQSLVDPPLVVVNTSNHYKHVIVVLQRREELTHLHLLFQREQQLHRQTFLADLKVNRSLLLFVQIRITWD